MIWKLNFHAFQVTSHEREVMSRFKWKFGLINIVFYICWLPNLVGGFILWTVWGSVPENIMVFIWYTMAATNPLQAFLNAFVYRRWAKTPSEPDPDPPTETHQESSPLLEKSRTWLVRAQPASSSKLENPSSHRKANNCSCFWDFSAGTFPAAMQVGEREKLDVTVDTLVCVVLHACFLYQFLKCPRDYLFNLALSSKVLECLVEVQWSISCRSW